MHHIVLEIVNPATGRGRGGGVNNVNNVNTVNFSLPPSNASAVASSAAAAMPAPSNRVELLPQTADADSNAPVIDLTADDTPLA
jgi:hypothetical protein